MSPVLHFTKRMFIFISLMALLGEYSEKAYISELFVCALEHSTVRWLHYVFGLWPQAAVGPEACCGHPYSG